MVYRTRTSIAGLFLGCDVNRAGEMEGEALTGGADSLRH